MPTRTPPPLDYLTRTAIAAVERLVVKKALSTVDAQSLLKAIAAERSTVSTQTDRHPDEEIEERIAEIQKAHPTLTRGQAQQQVMDADADLWERHMQAMRQGRGHPSPVAKAAPLPYDAIVKQARATQTAGQTTEQALAALALAHPDDGAYWEAHRRWRLSDAGLREHYLRDQAQG